MASKKVDMVIYAGAKRIVVGEAMVELQPDKSCIGHAIMFERVPGLPDSYSGQEIDFRVPAFSFERAVNEAFWDKRFS